MYQAIDSVFRKTTTLLAGNGTNPGRRPARSAVARGRRKDDLAFIVIAVLLGGLFLAQLGWLLLNRVQS
jgi:hypothetical protein